MKYGVCRDGWKMRFFIWAHTRIGGRRLKPREWIPKYLFGHWSIMPSRCIQYPKSAMRVGKFYLSSILGTKSHTGDDSQGFICSSRVSAEVLAVTLTYFTEFPLERTWTGTGKLGSPPIFEAGAAILAGIWPAYRNHCEHRKWGPKGSSERAATTSEIVGDTSCFPFFHKRWVPTKEK